MAMKKPGPYVALSAHYADDDKIMAAGEDAELLYIRMLAYCARQPVSEGWVSDAVLHSRLGILPRDPGNGTGNVPGTDAGSRAEKLREVGLIARDDNGWRIVSWLRWNRSAEEMGKERSRDRARKTAPTGGYAGNDPGTLPGNVPGNDPDSRQQRSETETETETKPEEETADLSPLRDDVERMLDYLDSRLATAGIHKRPNRTKGNRDAARLMLDIDELDPHEIRRVIDWATQDAFWSPHIRSARKLREKYPALRAQMLKPRSAPTTKQDRNLAILADAEARWAQQEQLGYDRRELA